MHKPAAAPQSPPRPQPVPSSGHTVGHVGPVASTRRRGWAFAILAGGLVFVLTSLAILERLGLPETVIDLVVPAAVAAAILVLGLTSRTMRISEFYLAGRRVPAVPNGMALAADWISGALFVGLAGTLFVIGGAGWSVAGWNIAGWSIAGWTGGFVLMAMLFAPCLDRSGALTVPDFLAARYGGRLVRVMGMAVLVAVSFLLLAGELAVIGFVASRFLGIGAHTAIVGALAVMVVCSLAGGMRALTWTQAALYLVLAAAFLTPLVLLSMESTAMPVPQIALADALADLRELLAGWPGAPFAQAGNSGVAAAAAGGPWDLATLVICLMIGTASLPHLLARFFTAPSPGEARRAAGWGLVFVALVLSAVPVYVVFAKLEIVGSIASAEIDALPEWVMRLGAQGLVRICGADAVSLEAIRQACTGLDLYYRNLAPADFALAPEAVVLALPQIAGMAVTLAAFLATGALAAALATANGLLLAIANSLAHDGFHRLAAPSATAARRLFAARLMLLVVATLAGYAALGGVTTLPGALTIALGLAAAGNFPALVLGIWWPRATAPGAVAGMAAGIAVALFFMLANTDGEAASAFGLGLEGLPGTLYGVATGFVVTFAVSLFTAPPGEVNRAFVETIHRRGSGVAIRDRAV
ncbi:VC_2705 family sodium/solute symporter [Breoghania corrubedonensis]|uniref:VC_2705 family sodium/solute symporter n=1 Tax=Breoghania corrubedonensis TaxID=665038 RepID=UPI001474F106|nr:VC_2705 family sodium/solute symporter [Breoghania corrubedonensis]